MNLIIPPASAHKIQTDKDVGATLHIEPNDTPRAGESAQTWFALTRKGGKIIPLKECDCQLAIYSQPRTTGKLPILQPTLQPVSAERYQGIPGTNITFPKPGAYQLELTGKPSDSSSFEPFKLEFDVTVAAGKKKPAQNQQEKVDAQQVKNVSANQEQNSSIPFLAIGLGVLAITGVFLAIKRKKPQ